MMEHRTDGVILCSSSFSSEQGRQLLKYGFPIVVVNHQAAENFHYSIYHDDVDGSRQITRHLLKLGHERIAYLGNSKSGRTTLDRLRGYELEMQSAKKPVQAEWIHDENGGEAIDGFNSVPYFLSLSPKPSAIVCFNDLMAIGVLKGLNAAGERVPEDISVTGFDNISMSAFSTPALTTLDQPKRSIGEEACHLLLSLLKTQTNGDHFEPKEKILKGKLLVRQSTSVLNPHFS
jgi:DNA-binding LacI/PurR family transcriptional regulator